MVCSCASATASVATRCSRTRARWCTTTTAGHHYVARSSAPLPAGPCELRYTFTKTGRLQGHDTVTIDGAAAGSVDVARTLSTHLSPAPLTVGRGPLSPVSPLYDAPFPFGGVLHTVVYEIGNDRAGVPTSPFLD